MADIALVTLELDSTGVVSGEKKATASLRLVESQMQRTEKQAQQLNTSLNTNVKRSGESFKGLADSAQRAGVSLQGLGGPLGRVGGSIGGLVGQAQDLTSNFGLLGGGALGAVAGVAALGSALIKLTLDGVRLSDNLADMGQSLGFSAEQMEKLNAASRLAGEDVGVVERSFAQFQQTIKSAVADPTSDAAKSLRTLGIDAKAASRDSQAAFLDLLGSLKSVTDNFEQLTAARDLFGRGTHSLIRTSEEFTRVMGLTNDQMVNFGFAATASANKAASDIDRAMNDMSLKFDSFKRSLADDWSPSIVGSINLISSAIEGMQHIGFAGAATGVAAGLLGLNKPTHPELAGLFDIGKAQRRGGIGERLPEPSPKPPGGAANKAAADALRAEEQFQRERLRLVQEFGAVNARFWERQLDEMNASSEALIRAIVDSPVDAMVEVGQRVGKIMKGVPLAGPLGGSGIPGGGPRPGQIIPGLSASGLPPHPSTVRTEEQARLDEQFSVIFDDMLVSILTAQKTLGPAFAGLALGIVDTFAVEFTKKLREDFITPVIQGLTDMLQSALKDLFGGLSAGGLKGVFGGIAKGVGAIFGGFFQAGGTLGAHQFGVVGERGAELIYSGASPLHVAPMATNTSGMNFTLIQNIHAPEGSISKRTQDQMANSVLVAVERANRNRGAR